MNLPKCFDRNGHVNINGRANQNLHASVSYKCLESNDHKSDNKDNMQLQRETSVLFVFEKDGT